MQLLGDERGVSTQVGAILLFATLIILLGIYQAQIVPAENRQAEFRHSQEIQGDMQRLYGTLFDIGASGGTRPVTLDIGFRYPSRLVAVNPPPVSGTLRANTTGVIEINGSANGNTYQNKLRNQSCSYQRGDGPLNTSTVEYEPDYNQYRNAPRTVYDNTALYQRGDGGETVQITNQSMLEGTNITLIVLASGDYRVSRAGTATVDLKSGRVGTWSLDLTQDSDTEVNLTIPSQLNATDGTMSWTRLLSDEDAVQNVAGTGDGRVNITLSRDETYTFTCYAVGFDETPPSGYRPLQA